MLSVTPAERLSVWLPQAGKGAAPWGAPPFKSAA